MRMLVLGAGLQGSACAFDLLSNPEVKSVVLADLRTDRVPAFLKPFVGNRLTMLNLNVTDEDAVRSAYAGCDGVMSAIPYYLNYPLARIAVECGVHFADLGGNTAIVQQQKALHDAAVAKNISVIPDTGLAPGMVNILAQYGIERFAEVESVRLLVGGLPQVPQPPLGYQIAYSIEGMIDYYTADSLVLRNGVPSKMTALSEVELVEFPKPAGELEAFHTAGGLSTMAYRYAGQIPVMEYKTLRFPGHVAIMEAIRELGLLSEDAVDVKGQQVVPRDVFVRVAGEKLRLGKPDMVVLRVEVRGKHEAGGASQGKAWELIDLYDANHGISAMMRTTGYTLSITGQMQVTGQVAAGVHTPDECIAGAYYIEQLSRRGIHIREYTL